MNQGIKEEDIVKCGGEGCESATFMAVSTFVKVSAVLSETGQAGIAPALTAYVCAACGTDMQRSPQIKELSEGASSIIV